MTIRDLDADPGSKAHARRIAPVTAPRIQSVEFVVASAQVDKGGKNIAVGRRGAVTVIDNLRFQGNAQDWVSSGGGAGAASGDGAFEVRSVNAQPGTYQVLDRLRFGVWAAAATTTLPFNYDIRKLGYVGNTQRDTSDRPFPDSIGAAMNTANGLSNAVISAECTADVRYLSHQHRAVRPGAWGSLDGTRTDLAAGPNEVIAAPGVGKYLRIHTLFIYAIGVANATTQYVLLGDDNNTAQANWKMWFRTNNINERCKIDVRLTNIDIPMPENKNIAISTPTQMRQAGNNTKIAVTIGAEICDINRGSWVTRTGIPA